MERSTSRSTVSEIFGLPRTKSLSSILREIGRHSVFANSVHALWNVAYWEIPANFGYRATSFFECRRQMAKCVRQGSRLAIPDQRDSWQLGVGRLEFDRSILGRVVFQGLTPSS